MGNKDRLLSADSNNAGLAELAVDGSVVGTKQEVFLAADVETLLLDARGIVKGAGNLGDFGLADVEASALSPHAVAGLGVDGGLVDLGGSYEVINVSWC